MKTAIFFATGLEELEGLTVVDILRRAGVTIDIVSVTDRLQVTGAHNITITADKMLADIDFDTCDMLILPGGMPGTTNLDHCAPLKEAIASFDKAGKRIAAICAAPMILGGMGLLQGRKATCYPGVDPKLTGATVTGEEAVTDGHITTGKGFGCAIPFALEIVRVLLGEEKAQALKEEIVYGH